MSSIKTVAVFGASGNLGPHIVKALLDSNFEITAITRPGSTSTFPSTIRAVQTDYSPSSLRSVLIGQDAVVCSMNFEVLDKQFAIIDVAVELGIKRVVLGEFGIPHEQQITEFAQTTNVKSKVQEYAKEKAKHYETFSWSAIANGPFIDWALTTFPIFGFDIKKRTATIYDSGNEPVTCTTIANVGKAVAESLKKLDETKSRWVKIRSVETTQNSILSELEKQTGKTWEKKTADTKDVLSEAKIKMTQGDFVGGFTGYLTAQLFTDGARRSVVTSEEESDNKLLSVPSESVHDIVKKVLATVGSMETRT